MADAHQNGAKQKYLNQKLKQFRDSAAQSAIAVVKRGRDRQCRGRVTTVSSASTHMADTLQRMSSKMNAKKIKLIISSLILLGFN